MPIGVGTAIALSAAATGASAAGGIYAAHSASNASKKSAALQTQSANYGADLAAKANADALAFQKEQEANRQKEFQSTQDRNFQLYQEQLQRLAPYRNMGIGALGQLSQPRPQPQAQFAPGTLGSMMGGR